MLDLNVLTAKIEPILDKPEPSEVYKTACKSPARVTVYNKQEQREESFTAEAAMDWLETIGMWAAYEMYSKADVTRLMNFARDV